MYNSQQRLRHVVSVQKPRLSATAAATPWAASMSWATAAAKACGRSGGGVLGGASVCLHRFRVVWSNDPLKGIPLKVYWEVTFRVDGTNQRCLLCGGPYKPPNLGIVPSTLKPLYLRVPWDQPRDLVGKLTLAHCSPDPRQTRSCSRGPGRRLVD